MSDGPSKTPGPSSRGGSPGRTDRARTGALVVVAVVMTLFAVLNVDTVRVHWIAGTSNVPLIIVIVISLLVGIVLTYFADRRSRKRS